MNTGPCSAIDATSTVDDLEDCPFCGSANLRLDIVCFDYKGDHDGVECECGASAPLEIWNRRAS